MSDTEYICKDAFISQQRKQYCVNCERRKGTKNGKRIFVYEIGEAPCRSCDIGDMIDAVWDFLPADVAPVVRGHWSKEMFYTEDFRGNITYGYKCSVCDELANRLQFCGNCGAKMDESEV